MESAGKFLTEMQKRGLVRRNGQRQYYVGSNAMLNSDALIVILAYLMILALLLGICSAAKE